MQTVIAMREIFHFCFLEQLLKVSDPTIYILKGGVNLRFFFHSPRYSEDMDIDVLAGNVETLKKNGYKILDDSSFKRKLQTFGIVDLEINDPSKAKHTETTQRFRFRLITETGERLATKVEFSRRKKDLGDGAYVNERIDSEIARQYNRLPFLCQHYTGAAAVLQKIEALAGRTQVQARDVFDIFILDLAGFTKDLDLSLLPQEQLLKAEEALLSVSYADFAGQVLEFLDLEVRSQYEGEDLWVGLQTKVLEILGS